MGVGSTFSAISRTHLEALPVPVAPLQEQRRIVAKVDELMALCDELEARQRQRAEVRTRLNRAALHHLTSASSAEELAEHWERLRENMETMFDAPDRISALRESILDLAVRGHLTAHESRDQSASMLLDEVAVAKGRAGGSKARRASTARGPVDSSPSFELPDGWAWTTLGALVDPRRSLSYGVLVPGPDEPSGVPFVRVQDITATPLPERPAKSIAREIEASYARTRLEGGEILIGVVGSIGAIGVVPDNWAGANIARALCRFAPAARLNRDYLELVLRSPLVQQYFADVTRTLAQPTLNVGQLEQTPIPLPPLDEQGRVVVRVRDLMSLCDALESRLTEAREKATHLAAAVVHRLTAV